MNTFSLVMTAAGTGSRFDATKDKLWIEIHHKPVIQHSIEAFFQANLQEIILVIHPKNQALFTDLLKQVSAPFPIRLVMGGDTRKDSVENGLNALKPCDIVLVHDGARPFVSAAHVQALMAAATLETAIVPGIAMVETIKRVKDAMVVETVPRETLFRVQTPQLFPKSWLLEAYTKLPPAFQQRCTDEAMLIEALQKPVYIVPGEPGNIKITHPQDLANIVAA